MNITNNKELKNDLNSLNITFSNNIQNNLNQQIKIYLNDKSFELKPLDLNQLPTNELTIFKDELKVIKEDLELKTNQLNDLVSKYEFKPNEHSISTKIIGEISEQKLSSNEVGHLLKNLK